MSEISDAIRDLVHKVREFATEDGQHYFSTACFHDKHEDCRLNCKYCHEGCRCKCGHANSRGPQEFPNE